MELEGQLEKEKREREKLMKIISELKGKSVGFVGEEKKEKV